MLRLRSFREIDFMRIGLALLFALLAAGATALFYSNRDFLVEWKRVKAVGEFSAAEDPKLRSAAIAFAQAKMARPGETCVGQWVGRDEKYLYMAVGCAKIEEKMGELSASGDSNFHPTRFRYDGEEIDGWEQPNREEYANSMRRLFPKEAQDLLRLNREIFLKMLSGKLSPEAPAPEGPVPHHEPVSSAL